MSLALDPPEMAAPVGTFSAAALAKLRDECATVTFSQGVMLLEEGQTYDHFYILLSGRVRDFSRLGNKSLYVAERCPGDIVGDLGLSDQRCTLSSQAIEQVTLLEVPYVCFERVAAEDSALLYFLVNRLDQRSQDGIRLAKSLALETVYERMRTLLVTEAARSADGQCALGLNNYQLIANHVGASRDMIGKIFKALRVGGYVALEDEGIRILRPLTPRY